MTCLSFACEGRCLSGPIWNHIVGYWNASKARPETVLFLSFEKMKNLKVNKADSSPVHVPRNNTFANDSFFRRGGAGDWTNHMTPEMARRLDAIMNEKLHGTGISFS
ncbi:hypothetical protein DAI22_07g033500 [Oryza sativa Japonica Group]|nr:hypothetical protein DAI22_07g033500 [Oryza sativa Japonica Group]